MDDVLTIFHPLVARWLVERLGRPTPIQHLVWPEIASGGNLLATAPTGSGKTLAAFLWAINQLITGKWQGGAPRILYVSPLKALNNDIRRNLLTPLDELAGYFREAGQPVPSVRVMTRSGDSTPEERRQLIRHPPEILITTPESLNIMLSSKSGSSVLHGVRSVILDEIHAVAGSKRGTHLITAVERLTLLSGEFQRIALSATVRPLEVVADFVGGFERLDSPGGTVYRKRPVKIIRSDEHKRYVVTVECPESPREEGEESFWKSLATELKVIVRKNRSTIIFTKSRRVAEKIARHINEGENEIIAYSHHGSIAREIRLEVEERLKRGELKAIVATSSLELGIDIGELDEVILVETPFSISSALQRLGRGGHGVGETSRGRIFPCHGMDFLAAAVMARSIETSSVEPIRPAESPLDILAQIILSMTCSATWDMDALYAFLRSCYPYRNLAARQFEQVLEMLAGRYAATRLRELTPRLSIDRIDKTVAAKAGASYLLYTSGGTIPDRGYFELRVKGSGARIGELDEEFVWERRVGDTFTLGTQVWRIEKITHNEVEVFPHKGKAGIVPFWRAEEQDRDFHYAERIMAFLQEADAGLSDAAAFRQKLETTYGMSPPAALSLTELLLRQKDAAYGKLPHRKRIVIEYCHEGGGRSGGLQAVIHTFWGGRLNRPFSMALAAAWEKKHGVAPEVYANDENILLIPPDEGKIAGVFPLVRPENIEDLLRGRREASGFFGARFRENASRALLLPRAGFHRRYPLWLNRLRAKRLHENVLRFPDFPITLETWRECLQDAFDLANLKVMLDELQSGSTEIIETQSEVPSPFCAGVIWRQTNRNMYADDTPEGRVVSGVSRRLLDELLSSSRLRPRIPVRLAKELEEKLQRLRAGYAPATPLELLEWLKERLLIPAAEWQALLGACRRDSAGFPPELPANITQKLASVNLGGSHVTHLCAAENLQLVRRLFHVEVVGVKPGKLPRTADSDSGEMDRSEFVCQWLSYYGPVRRSRLEEELGVGSDDLDNLLEGLVEEGRIIVEMILEGSETVEVCVSDNLDRLLRLARLARQPSFHPLSIDYLHLFLASYQGLVHPGDSPEALQTRLEKLFGYVLPAHLWEEEILPARIANYQPSWLDTLLHTSPLFWFGMGRQAVTFALEQEKENFITPRPKDLERAQLLFPDTRGRYDLFTIANHAGLGTTEATSLLWELTWRSAVTNDSMETLRKGILNGFTAIEPDRGGRGTSGTFRSSALKRWAASRPVQGNWRYLDVSPGAGDLLEEHELAKERARILFDRYGILFRELLENETEAMGWGRLFPALRLMELAGEILSGYFFEGIPGIQFISSEALRILQDGLDEEAVYWMNAKDPASLCGVGLEGIKGGMPRRVPSNHLVFQGRRIILESLRSGRELRFAIPSDHPGLGSSLVLFENLMSRKFNPEKGVLVEKINGVAAEQSEYRDALLEFGFSGGYRGLELRRKY